MILRKLWNFKFKTQMPSLVCNYQSSFEGEGWPIRKQYISVKKYMIENHQSWILIKIFLTSTQASIIILIFSSGPIISCSSIATYLYFRDTITFLMAPLKMQRFGIGSSFLAPGFIANTQGLSLWYSDYFSKSFFSCRK